MNAGKKQGNGPTTEERILERWLETEEIPKKVVLLPESPELAAKLDKLARNLEEQGAREPPAIIAVGGVNEAKAYVPWIVPAEHVEPDTTPTMEKVQVTKAVDPRQAVTEVVRLPGRAPANAPAEGASEGGGARAADGSDRGSVNGSVNARGAGPLATQARWAMTAGAGATVAALVTLLLFYFLIVPALRGPLRTAISALRSVELVVPREVWRGGVHPPEPPSGSLPEAPSTSPPESPGPRPISSGATAAISTAAATSLAGSSSAPAPAGGSSSGSKTSVPPQLRKRPPGLNE